MIQHTQLLVTILKVLTFHNIPDWNGGNGAVVYQDNLQTNQNTESVFDKWNNIFDE